MENMATKQLPRIQDADLKDKIVLVRVDHNVVKKGVIKDPYRIDSTIGTLFYIAAKGGKPILMTHCGRPRDKKTNEINISQASSIQPIVDYLETKLHVKLKTPEFPVDGAFGYAGVDDSIKAMLDELKSGAIDGIYLPNTRWFKGEERKDDENRKLSEQLAAIADVYVNDAFGSWQPHASTAGVATLLPAYAGFLMQKEIDNLDRIFAPERPFVAVVAGSKFDTKIASLAALLKLADKVVLGGVMYNAYICAKYGVEIEGIGEEDVASAKEFVELAKDYKDKVVEMDYVVESDSLDGKFDGKYRTRKISELKSGDKLNYVLDVAKESFESDEVKQTFAEAKTFFVNAVMGFVPNFIDGTIALDKIIDANKDAMKLFGGGDTLQEMKNLVPDVYLKALDSDKYYLFTGGGAVLKAIQEGRADGIEPVKLLIENDK